MSNGPTPAPKLPEEVTMWQLAMMLNEMNTRMGRLERILDVDNLMIRFDRAEQQVLRVEERLKKGDEEIAKIGQQDTRIRMLEDEAMSRRWVFRLVVGAALTSMVGWVAIVIKWVVTSMSKGTP